MNILLENDHPDTQCKKDQCKDQLHVQHITNAKYKKYLHQGYKIQQGYKHVVLKIIQQHLKVLKKCYKAVI